MRAAALLLAALTAACSSLSVLPGPERDFEWVVEGNEELDRAAIEGILAYDLAQFEEQEHDRAAADDAAFALEIAYRRRGFRQARVEYSIEPGPKLVLRVTEGPRTTLDEEAVQIRGVKAFSREEVLAFLEGPRLGALGRGPLLYVENRVRSVPGAMVGEYVHRGYLDAEVDPIEVEFVEDGTVAHLTLTAREGSRYRVGDVRRAPGTPRVLDPATLTEIFERFSREEGEPRGFDPRLPFELRGAISERLAVAGRPDSEVRVETEYDREHAGGPRVHLLVSIRPGPVVTIGELRFSGNEITRDSFLESRLRLAQGDRFDDREARASLRRLYRTGLFKSIDLTLVEDGDEQGDSVVRDLLVTVEEGPTREYFVEPGYGSYELLRFRVGARERNLFGTGRQVRAEATAAIRALRAEVGFTDPWLFGTDLIGDVPFEFDQRENPSFTSRSTGVGAFVTKEWGGPSTATTFGYQLRRSEVMDVDVVDREVLGALENVDISSLSIVQRFERRDNVLMPRQGFFGQARIEWGDRALGSELDFLRTDLTLQRYEELIEGELVLAASARTAVIAPRGESEDIPLQERYFNGGENSVRAFGEHDLGPKDAEGNPLGGETRTVFNLELQRRISGPWELAVFADAGTVEPNASDWLSFGDVRYGLGLGLRYRLPIGPIRLDVGWNPEPREGEDEFVPHLAIGLAF